MNAKIERVNKDIDKTKEKINEFQARLRELEKQKTELENIEIVESVRGTDISLNDLPAVLKALREQNGALFTSGQVRGVDKPHHSGRNHEKSRGTGKKRSTLGLIPGTLPCV